MDQQNNKRSKATTKISAWGNHNAKEWVGTLRTSGGSVVVHIKETLDSTMYRVLHYYAADGQQSHYNCDELMRSYFQLDTPLHSLYQEWSSQCPRMHQIALSIPGVRILQQDPWECLISFICSSNNNIPRITSMLQSIRQTYGHPIDNNKTYYTFPSPQELSMASEAELRSVCGLGYRAKYIVQTTRQVLEWGGEPALLQLRGQDYATVHARLMELAGVGPKVADCVALFSLGQDTHAIPVDVHVWNICLRDYASSDPVLSSDAKSLTPTLYKRVQQVFRQKFPTKTAWAHSLLFVAELPSFRPALPECILREMDEFKKEEQEKKNSSKRKKEAT